MNDNKQDINQIEVILVEKKRTAQWLAEQQHRDQATVFLNGVSILFNRDFKLCCR